MKRVLHNLDPSLGFFNLAGMLQHSNWREFKRNRNNTGPTMNVLLKRRGDDFFAKAKQVRGENKLVNEISPYASEFFKVFLDQKSGFVRPSALAYSRP